MIDTDKYEGQIEFDDVLREIEVGVDISEGNYDILRYYRDEYKDLLAEVKRLRGALAYTASLLTCRIEGDDIPVTDIREYALDVVDMTVDEAMATTGLMEE